MAYEHPSRDRIKTILEQAGAIAVVGLTNNPDRPAYEVSEAMLHRGYRIIPVNPKGEDVLGQKGYASLKDIPESIDIVNVFRRAEHTPPIAEEAAAVGAKTLWLQLGIASEEAARIASESGMTVIMDRCIKVEDAVLRPNRK
ncbi:CoA-binding protein [Paenibacillus antri]|uniref:CoA-binding protein n=1 Tax=Paenibacillus antri TaxID=2582848 RepID=A0A5R9GEY2_9BACL|nr:CoA-binding protein [Paenibacillus antri]TLS49955.1 CoA-binding protein [Paenibacillus antri]